VRDGESVLELSHGSLEINLNTEGESQASAQGGAITIRLTAACAEPASGPGETIAPDVRRFRRGGSGQTAEVVDVFPGGCVSFRPEPDMGSSESLMGQAEGAVTYQTRDDLREALRRRSDGRLQLDPAGQESG
jgi:hypothetical protein